MQASKNIQKSAVLHQHHTQRQWNCSITSDHVRHDAYVEETESIVSGTTILSIAKLAVVITMLAKEYPMLAT